MTAPIAQVVGDRSHIRKVEYRDRASWLLARHKGIGASEVAAILGMNPYRSAFAVWAEKVAPEPPADSDEETEAARWGNILEEPIAQEVSRRIGRRLVDHGRHTIFYNDRLSVPLFASLDREIDPLPWSMAGIAGESRSNCGYFEMSREGWLNCARPAGHDKESGHDMRRIDPRGPGAYEGKTAGFFVSREEWADEGPVHHLVQLQAQLAVLEWSWGLLGGLIAGQKLILHEHVRDDEFIAWMLGRVEWFWDLVVRKEPPPVDGSDSTAEAIKRLYAKGGGPSIDLPPMAAAWAKQRAEGKDLEKRGKKLVQEAENLIKAAIGDADVGVLPGGSSGFRWPVVNVKASACPNCKVVLMEASSHRRLTAFDKSGKGVE